VRLLVADSHGLLSEKAHKALGKDGYAVDCVDTEAQRLDATSNACYDLCIVGLAMASPDSDLALRRLLNPFEKLPVIVVCNSRKAQLRIKLLNMGADDVMSTPLTVQELVAKVRAVLRRVPTAAHPELITSVGPIRLYPHLLSATLDELPVALTHREYRLLEVLMRKRDQVLSRTQLEDSLYAWGEEVGSNTVEVYVHQLRRKLRPEVINTIRGVGYQLAPALWN
jgi:DNA-binding response OmpR family regulator